jgi:DNA-binding MarR family transcriptional regulator
MAALDPHSVIALIHRLAGTDRRARDRVARLLSITRAEARAVLALAGGGTMTLQALQAELDLSPGGALALAVRLERDALVRREPDPYHPHEPRLRLSPGAELELAAALAPLADRLEAIAGGLSAADRRAVARYLAELAEVAAQEPVTTRSSRRRRSGSRRS